MGSKKEKEVNTDNYQRDAEIEGDTPEDTKLLRSMAGEARAYLHEFDWCPPIRNLYLAFGIGGVVGLYLAELGEKIDDQDEFLWVVVGDLPSAYMVADAATPLEAFQSYCSMMGEWADAVESDSPLDELYPVAAKPTRENALILRKRLSFLNENVLPSFLKG